MTASWSVRSQTPVEPSFALDCEHVLERYAHGEVWRPLPGLNPSSASWVCGQRVVVKCSRMSPFRAELLQWNLRVVHETLATHSITPELRDLSYDQARRLLSSVYTWYPAVGTASVGEIGKVLGRAHRELASVEVSRSVPWLGYYGEYHEFAIVLAGVQDAQLRQSGERLLPHASRRYTSVERQLVHRDLHRDNVVRAADSVLCIDWDMAHMGRCDDDLANTVCCVVADSPRNQVVQDAELLVAAYRHETGATWANLAGEGLRSSLAVAALRQGIAGWYSDEGDTSAGYWPRIRRRMEVAVELLGA